MSEDLISWFKCIKVFNVKNLRKTEEKTSSGRCCQSQKKCVGSLLMKIVLVQAIRAGTVPM